MSRQRTILLPAGPPAGATDEERANFEKWQRAMIGKWALKGKEVVIERRTAQDDLDDQIPW